MRRITIKKTASPKKQELKVIKTKILSSQAVFDGLKRKQVSVKNEIKKDKELAIVAQENRIKLENEFKKFNILLSKKQQELSVLDGMIGNRKKNN